MIICQACVGVKLCWTLRRVYSFSVRDARRLKSWATHCKVPAGLKHLVRSSQGFLGEPVCRRADFARCSPRFQSTGVLYATLTVLSLLSCRSERRWCPSWSGRGKGTRGWPRQ
jgi:hypothetical protein